MLSGAGMRSWWLILFCAACDTGPSEPLLRDLDLDVDFSGFESFVYGSELDGPPHEDRATVGELGILELADRSAYNCGAAGSCAVDRPLAIGAAETMTIAGRDGRPPPRLTVRSLDESVMQVEWAFGDRILVRAIAPGDGQLEARSDVGRDLFSIRVRAIDSLEIASWLEAIPLRERYAVGDGAPLRAIARAVDGEALFAAAAIDWVVGGEAEVEVGDATDTDRTLVVGRTPGLVTAEALSGEARSSVELTFEALPR